MPLIFISHAAADRPLAESLAKRLESSGTHVKAFVASRPGDIRADAQWLPSVQAALRDANAYVILLSPNSVLRPWVNFECGAAWWSGNTCVLVRAGGLTPDEIPLPLSSNQVYSLEVPDEFGAVLEALGLGRNSTDVNAFVGDALFLSRQLRLAGESEPAWEGVDCQGDFYAWAGPLLGLDDKASVPCPAQLPDLLRQRGLTVRFGNKDRLAHHYGRGRAQVFATDRKYWRRPVETNGRLLLVARPEDLKS